MSLAYGRDDRGIVIYFPGRGDFSVLLRFQRGFGTNSTTYSKGVGSRGVKLTTHLLLVSSLRISGVLKRGAVVEALHYKPEGRGIDSG
jgi:hypothetical protein